MSGPSSLRREHRTGDVLVRAPGPTAPVGFAPLGPELAAFLVREAGRAWRWCGGVGDATERRYRVAEGASSLGVLALGPAGRRTPWDVALRHLGAALARLHAVPTQRGPHQPPPALRRLEAFLAGRVDPPASGRRERLVAALGEALLAELVADCRRALTPAHGVLSHGWAGLNTWYPDRGGAVGLVGEDHGLAAREHDLGAVLGQLVELDRLVPGFAAVCPAEEARRALLAGYGAGIDGAGIDGAWLDREVRLAITRHIADYAVHTRGPETELDRYAALIRDLDVPSASGARTEVAR